MFRLGMVLWLFGLSSLVGGILFLDWRFIWIGIILLLVGLVKFLVGGSLSRILNL